MSRQEPSPFEYHSYRTRNQIDGFASVDFDELDGIRLPRGQRFEGVAGAPFGRLQAPDLIPSLGGGTDNRCLVLIAEGGVAPYNFHLSQPLPIGLQTTVVSFPEYGDLLCIHGTPIEVGIKELAVTIDDATTNQPVTLPIWIDIDAPLPPVNSLESRRPHIYAGGFGGTVLSGSGTTNVPVEVHVDDPDDSGSALTVEVFDETGNSLGTLPHSSGDLYAGSVSVTHSTGQAFSFRAIATDAAGNQSPMWPYVRIDGGPSAGQAELTDEHVLGQSAANTPTIDRVEFLSNTIPAAQVSEGTGEIQSVVYVDSLPANQIVRYVEIYVTPPYEGVDPYVIPWRWPGPATSHTIKFYSSRGEFGWGDYGFNVRLVTEGQNGANYYSDWWPQLLTH